MTQKTRLCWCCLPLYFNINSKHFTDAENDKILISCEEDFRLYIEQGEGKKVFFSVLKRQAKQPEEDEVAMEAEESNAERQKTDRNVRKVYVLPLSLALTSDDNYLFCSNSAREEEKQKRAAKRLAEKMRQAEEKVRHEEERRSKHLSSEKHERKHAEKLERAKRRCEQIRQIIGAAIDPANLSGFGAPHVPNPTAASSTSTASVQTSVDPSLASMHPSPETIRLLSNAIAGCLQPCNLINKILNDIIGMVPQPASEASTQATAQPTSCNDQQQQTEFMRQNTATNTSDMNTPVSGHPSSQEIEALFKEAAKELEKMNEIVNNSKSMETSTGSLASSLSVITQVMQNMGASTSTTASDETVINVDVDDVVDSGSKSPAIEDDYKIVTPPKSMRSRESSIEVHDVNSMMSDDSRDWTILDAATNDFDDETSIDPNVDESLKNSAAAETQTQTLPPVAGSSNMTDEEIRTAIQRSIEAVGEVSQVVKNSIAIAQESLKSVQQPVDNERIDQLMKEQVEAVQVSKPSKPIDLAPVYVVPQVPVAEASANLIQAETRPENVQTPPAPRIPTIFVPLGTLSATTQANLAASRLNTGTKRKEKPGPTAPVIYHENPKINTAVNQMMFMGFSNEGED